jgi:hypothetical protein
MEIPEPTTSELIEELARTLYFDDDETYEEWEDA